MSTVLITGANRGIGLALVKAYLADGVTVIATARVPEEASELGETGAEIIPLDVTDPVSVGVFAQAVGTRPVDLLIHNAGIGDRAPLGALDYDKFSDMLAVNTIAPIRVIEALRANVAASQGRTIAVLSSQLGSIGNTTAEFGLIYRVSKAGLNMGLRTAAITLAGDGITTLSLHPGWVSTDMGGPSAPVTPAQSAAGLKAVIANAGPAVELRFLDWQGETLPW